jgi:DNA replication protein DnaC
VAIWYLLTHRPSWSHEAAVGKTLVILTTNRPFKEWNEVFPNAACIVTLLDRLLHHADVTKIEGDSYRVRESEQETARRRRK